MARKENKGGILTNSQIEKDIRAKGKSPDKTYVGSQDTGDAGLRQKGNGMQKREGREEGSEKDRK